MGSTKVWMREDENCFCLHPDEYDRLVTAWMNGVAFYTGRDCYESQIVLKLGAVVAVALQTAEQSAEIIEDLKSEELTGS